MAPGSMVQTPHSGISPSPNNKMNKASTDSSNTAPEAVVPTQRAATPSIPSKASATAPTVVAGQLNPGAVRVIAQKLMMSPNRVVVMGSAKDHVSRRMKLRLPATAMSTSALISVPIAGRIYSAAETLSHSSPNG